MTSERPLAQQLSRAFAISGTLVIAGLVVTLVAFAVSWTRWTPESRRSRLAATDERIAFGAMVDEETGLRGYLLTHDTDFLEPYTRAQATLAHANEALVTFVDADLSAQMLATLMAEQRWHDLWALAAADTRGGAIPPSALEGKLLFDTYRTTEKSFARALETRNDDLARREQRLIALRISFTSLIMIAVLFLAHREHRLLREAIVSPVAALLQRVARVRDGQLDAVVVPSGPLELRELGEGLNEMVLSLAMARKAAAARDDALRGHTTRLRQILDASREFSESLNLGYVIDAVRASTKAVSGFEHVVVWLTDAERKHLVNADGKSPEDSLELGHGLAGRAAKAGRIAFENAAGQVRFVDGALQENRAIAIPLIVGARVVGALESRHDEASITTTQTTELLEMLADHAANAIEAARLHAVIEERSQVDALTRLFNRRRLEEDLEAECKRCARYARPLAFIMLDVDNFKAFNDSHGHPHADTALQEVADVLVSCVRTTDTAYRYGGEEFCIVLRETGAADAMVLAERIRKRVEQRFATGNSIGITASFGVAEFSEALPLPQALVESADAAMYQSKHAGRNRVTMSSRPPAVPS